MEHNLVPKFRILSDEEKTALLVKFNINENNLPKIFDSDPVVSKIDAKPGNVLEIIRNSEVAGESLYYRLVIQS